MIIIRRCAVGNPTPNNYWVIYTTHIDLNLTSSIYYEKLRREKLFCDRIKQSFLLSSLILHTSFGVDADFA
jgi:hypothetical protein